MWAYRNIFRCSKLVLEGRLDDFNCFHILGGAYLDSFLENPQLLCNGIIAHEEQNDIKAYWIQLNKKQLPLAAHLERWGFTMHHCRPQYLLFYKWLNQKESCSLPGYVSHLVKCQVLIEQNEQTLMMREDDTWVLPFGILSNDELMPDFLKRHAKETLGLEIQVGSIVDVSFDERVVCVTIKASLVDGDLPSSDQLKFSSLRFQPQYDFQPHAGLFNGNQRFAIYK